MADDKGFKPEENNWSEGWKKITEGYERGDALKEGPYVHVSKAGALEAGAEATAMAIEAAQARGYGQYQWAFDFIANEEKGQIACIPIPMGQASKESAPVRWYEGKGSPRAAWHVGGVFKQCRSLQPKSDVKCYLTKVTGPDGLPVLIIPIKANLSTQTSTGDETPGSQAAASEEK